MEIGQKVMWLLKKDRFNKPTSPGGTGTVKAILEDGRIEVLAETRSPGDGTTTTLEPPESLTLAAADVIAQ